MARKRRYDGEEYPREDEPRDYEDEYADTYDEPRTEDGKAIRYTRKQKLALEKKLVKEGRLVPRYTPRNPVGRIIALILVFFLGMFATIGGVIGVAVYYGNRPVKEPLSLFNIPYEEYLTQEAADKTILGIVETVTNLQGINSLNAIAEFTPLVDTLIDGVDEQLSALGIHIDKTTLKTTEFSALGEYFSQNVVKTIVLGEVLNLKPSDNPMLIALCYGEEGVDYVIETTGEGEEQTPSFVMLEGHEPATVGSITDSDMNELLKKITIETALEINADSDPAFRYLAFGTEGVNYRIDTTGETKKIVMLQDEEGNLYKKRNISSFVEEGTDLLFDAKISDLFDSETLGEGILNSMAEKDWTLRQLTQSGSFDDFKIGEIINAEGSDGILGAVKDWTVSELGDGEKIKTLRIGDIIDTKNSDGILGAIGDWTINDLGDTNRIKRLKISQIIGETEGDGILGAISSWRIGDLDGGKFDSLALNDILKLDENSPQILKVLAPVPLGDLSSAVNDLSIGDMLGDVSDNKILKNVQNSTLETLSSDLQSLSARDVFGDEIYTYRAIGEDGKTYADIVKAYDRDKGFLNDETGIRTTELKPLTLGENQTVGVTYSVSGTPVEYGVFKSADNGTFVLVENARLYGSGENLYIKEEIKLTPVHGWRIIDYSAASYGAMAKPLPEGAAVSANYGDKTLGSPEGSDGTPLLQDGAPLYYTTADKYYPLYEDAFSCYYYDENGSRADLEQTVVSYTCGGASLPVTDGKVTYLGKEYTVRTKAATQEHAAYDYIEVQTAVRERYYNAADMTTLYTKEQVKEHYRLSDGTEVERFLDGVWYMLFGGETYDESGNITVFDNTDTAITEIAPLVTKVTDVLNETPMWGLYLHGIITSNPYVKNTLTSGRNINELTIAGCIYFLRTGHFPADA